MRVAPFLFVRVLDIPNKCSATVPASVLEEHFLGGRWPFSQ